VGFWIGITKRELHTNLKAKGLPWERAKSFDNSAVFSDFVTFGGNINDLRMELYINGNLVQRGGCNLMINMPYHLLDEAKSFLSFEDGDLMMTGTPEGVGPVNSGDKFIGIIFDKDKSLIEGSWLVI
jgi:2-keto-4-pentenoate hydratase/2-oxohepta-3-ene-1,7-dioic acid hydratase in catechol pathway